jgi:hypothetical protein
MQSFFLPMPVTISSSHNDILFSIDLKIISQSQPVIVNKFKEIDIVHIWPCKRTKNVDKCPGFTLLQGP